MANQQPRKGEQIAIIGGGPAGSLAATHLARAGRRVLLLDEKLAWEKPCGGGITHKAVVQYRFLREAQVERNWVDQCELISPAGRRVCFRLNEPIAIFSRHVLNGLLLEMAGQAGAEVVQSRVTSVEGCAGNWQLGTTSGRLRADYVVFAAGARNPFRGQFTRPFRPEDLMATAGYYIPGASQQMQVQFVSGLHGYIWIFPRVDHFSAGICGRMTEKSTAELRRMLEEALTAAGLTFKGTQFYAHVLPALRPNTLRQSPVSGAGWAMIGDAAGFTDPISGEGLYYALRSAELLAEALVAEQPESYPALVKKDFLGELEMAARVADRFFTGRWMGEAVTERMVQFTEHSPRFQRLMCDMFAGTQGYSDLRQRLYRTLPAMVAESAVSALGLRRRESRMQVRAKMPS
jgi:geranylgeranyl diphosphate/geranylgeranyl-bacteriochlorophyllide a reductase